MKTFFKTTSLIILGFLLYPLLFVPVTVKWFPKIMEWVIINYAEYLRLWGI